MTLGKHRALKKRGVFFCPYQPRQFLARISIRCIFLVRPAAYLYNGAMKYYLLKSNRAAVQRIALLILGLGLFASLMPHRVYGQALYRTHSKYYNIESNLDRQELKRWAKHMDVVCKSYNQTFRNYRNQTDHRGRLRMILLKTKADYIQKCKSFGLNGKASGGMFFANGKTSGLITWVHDLPESHVIKTLQHEGFHQFAYHLIGTGLPLWANEGMAEYLGDAVLIKRGRSLKVGIADYLRIKAVQKAIKAGKDIPFGELIYMNSKTWQGNMLNGSSRGSFQYAQSWSVIYFLIHATDGKRKKPLYKRALFTYFKHISFGLNNREAFARAFKTTNTRLFHKRWRDYMLKLKPDANSTAMMKLEFLAGAMQRLFNKRIAKFNQIAQLKDFLQTIGYRLRKGGHGGATIIASDHSLYYYQTSKSPEKHDFILSPTEDGTLPPNLSTAHLPTNIHLIWFKNEKGRAVYRILVSNKKPTDKDVKSKKRKKRRRP